jgi:F420-dependent oxidoreductase-like protein
MRIGMILETRGTVDEVVDRARGLEAAGVSSLWATQIFGWDTLTCLAVVGREVPRVQLGTAVVPIHPRHPAILAAQALTVQAATGGRLVLGVGLSHRVVVEGVWGLSYEHPARHMTEYLSVLVPLLRGEQVEFEGESLRTRTMGPLETAGVSAPPVLVAALATRMLGIAGRQADGTVTWMVGLKTLAEHIVPTIDTAAAAAARPAPRVVVNLPVCVTAHREEALRRCGERFVVYGQLPSYRAMLDREGAAGPPDVAIVGEEEEVAAGIARLAEAGATEFCGAAFGTREEISRTQALLGQLTAS